MKKHASDLNKKFDANLEVKYYSLNADGKAEFNQSQKLTKEETAEMEMSVSYTTI